VGLVPGIVSLLPSSTEWVCALGLDDKLVGVTFECDSPTGVRDGRAVVVDGLPTRDDDGRALTPGAIDALVRRRLSAGLPLYHLDVDAVRALAPDVVVTQDLCAVCALPADAARDAVALLGEPADVVPLDPHTLPDVLAGAVAVAVACGAADAGERLRAELQQRLDAVAAAVEGRPSPRVLVLEWTDPPFVAGHWVPDLVVAAGGDPVLAVPGGRSTTTSWEAVAAADVDAVLVAPCGVGVEEARAQAVGVLPRLPADAAVWAIAAGDVVTRPGPRVVDGVEALAAAWHPGSASERPDLVALVRPGRGSRTTDGGFAGT
jgi:iron complex transport system substrate-binding protein